MGKKISGAQKRNKKKEKEEAIKEAAAEMERLKLGPSKLLKRTNSSFSSGREK